MGCCFGCRCRILSRWLHCEHLSLFPETYPSSCLWKLSNSQLFASNIALPMIAYAFWTEEVSSLKLTYINIATLTGTLLGQLAFGFLADKNGRKKMYGIELVLLIGSTLGVVMCSTGTHHSMSVLAWLIWWRTMVGIGVGGDYPLSAVITSE